MSDEAAAGSGAFCLICCEATLFNYCMTVSYGSGSSSGQAGCCGKCCRDSFNEDPFFDEAAKKDLEQTRRPSADIQVEQPPPSATMSTVAPGGEMISSQPNKEKQ